MKWRRMLALMVVGVLMLAMPAVSRAAGGSDAGISPLYNYTLGVEAGLHISDSGSARCQGAVAVYDESSTISLKVSLYMKVGSSWDRVKSWYGSSTGKGTLNVANNYQLSEYGTYKVLVTGTVTSANGGSEWISLESDHVTYP